MKKYIAFLSAIIMTLSAASSCSLKPAESSEKESSEAVETATEALIEIDPFEGIDFHYRHNIDGSVEEKANTNFFKAPKSIIVDNSVNEIQVLSDTHLDGIKKLSDLGCKMTIYRSVLDPDLKEGDTVTLRIMMDNEDIPEKELADHVAKTYGIRLTRTSMDITVHFTEDPVEEIDPFDEDSVYAYRNGSFYEMSSSLDEYVKDLDPRLEEMELSYELSLAEGIDLGVLCPGDKVSYKLVAKIDGKTYKGDEINEYLDSGWKRIRFSETEREYEVKPYKDFSRYSGNVNVNLNRAEDWKKIISDDRRFTKYDLAHIDGSTATIPITAELIRQYCGADDESVEYYIDHNTTSSAYENLIFDNYDKTIIFVTEPSEDELKMAKENHVELEADKIALDGFVFITHKDNPVDSLTLDQIRDIYTGRVTNWSQVGGNDEEIIPYVRTANSGSQTAMENMVMNGEEIVSPPEIKMTLATGMGDLIEKVAEYSNSSKSIGYTFNYYLNELYQNGEIKVLKINGISPDNENLLDGSYPLSSGYYAVTLKGGDAKAEEIKEYLLSDEGQEIIKLAGYCPIK